MEIFNDIFDSGQRNNPFLIRLSPIFRLGDIESSQRGDEWNVPFEKAT